MESNLIHYNCCRLQKPSQTSVIGILCFAPLVVLPFTFTPPSSIYLFSSTSFNSFPSFKFQSSNPPQRGSRFFLFIASRGGTDRVGRSGMKRPLSGNVVPATGDDKKMKKVKLTDSDEEPDNRAAENSGGFAYFDENLLFEVLKHVDAKTLAMAGCVSRQWYKTAQDERLWELICSKQWANTGCSEQQLRTVVLALGGFRRLYALYLGPLSKPQPSSTSSSSSWAALPKVIRSKPQSRLGKDEVHLSLCLMSISCYEKMNFNKGSR